MYKAVRIATLIVVLFALSLTTAVPTHSQSAVAGHVIALDPGHGGDELGSTACPGLLEKDANLDIALRLEKLLKDNGATDVYLTRRTTEENPSSKERAAIVNDTDAEVLVNLHLNGWEDSSMDGLYVLYGKMRKDAELAQVMHDAMWDPLREGTPSFTDFGTRQFAAGVLLWSEIPSVLTESVFISSQWECEKLTDGSGDRQDEIAAAILAGLEDWFEQEGAPTKPGKK
jgi:N-acetylmuramoyl-L-alanine amidase